MKRVAASLQGAGMSSTEIASSAARTQSGCQNERPPLWLHGSVTYGGSFYEHKRGALGHDCRVGRRPRVAPKPTRCLGCHEDGPAGSRKTVSRTAATGQTEMRRGAAEKARALGKVRRGGRRGSQSCVRRKACRTRGPPELRRANTTFGKLYKH